MAENVIAHRYPAAAREAAAEEDLNLLPQRVLFGRRRVWDKRSKRLAPMVARSWPKGLQPHQFASQWRNWCARADGEILDEAVGALFNARPDLKKHGHGAKVAATLWREAASFFPSGVLIPYRTASSSPTTKFRREVARAIARYKGTSRVRSGVTRIGRVTVHKIR